VAYGPGRQGHTFARLVGAGTPGHLAAKAWILGAKLKALAVTTTQRMASLPQVPTVAEADNLAAPKNSPAEFASYMRAEASKFDKLIKDAGIKIDP
jgi:Tripartite tricarboxylate transporter family receptor